MQFLALVAVLCLGMALLQVAAKLLVAALLFVLVLSFFLRPRECLELILGLMAFGTVMRFPIVSAVVLCLLLGIGWWGRRR